MKGRVIDGKPDMRYVVVRKRSRGHGHVIVYEFDEVAVKVLRIFHTSQNWTDQV